MNLLVASSRQWLPQDEWRLSAIRSVLEEALATRINWVLYDRNPDLMNVKGPRTHRLSLRSNSFHHQSLLPFSGVVLAGSQRWQGHEFEVLYGLLSKVALPLLALGIEIPDPPREFSEIEKKSFNRVKNLIVAADDSTKQWFKSQGITAQTLSNPLLLTDPHLAFKSAQRNFSLPSVALVLQRMDYKTGIPLLESAIRNQCSLAKRLHAWFPTELICLTSDDFMRFSPVFPNAVFYSFEAEEYATRLSRKHVLISMDPDVALMGTASGCQSLLLQDPQETASPYYTLVDPHNPDLLREKVQERLIHRRESEMANHLSVLRKQWVDLLRHHLGSLLEETNLPLTEELLGSRRVA